MNYKPLIKDKLDEFTKACPEYSIAEINYSTNLELAKMGVDTACRRSMLSVSDEMMYTAMCRALLNEEEFKNS